MSFFSEPYVTEDELKLMLRGAELSGAIEEEEQVIKGFVLKTTRVFFSSFCFMFLDIIFSVHKQMKCNTPSNSQCGKFVMNLYLIRYGLDFDRI